MEFITINISDLPSNGKFYSFSKIKFKVVSSIDEINMENSLFSFIDEINIKDWQPEVLPAEPITKPAPVKIPRPEPDEPFNVPAPLISPNPKANHCNAKLNISFF